MAWQARFQCLTLKFAQTEFVRRPHWMVVDDNPDALSLLPGLLRKSFLSAVL
jgi:hypothetical protein